MNNWRNDPVTKAQKRAIRNMSKRWKIETSGANNKGEAHDEIARLIAKIAEIKLNGKRSIGLGFIAGMSAQDEWAFEVGYGPFH